DEQYATHILTLSYIEPKALTMMNQKDVISEKTYEKMMDILKNAPYEGSFFPKEYDVEDKTYKNFKFKLATCAFVNFAVIENTFLYAVVSNFISLLNASLAVRYPNILRGRLFIHCWI